MSSWTFAGAAFTWLRGGGQPPTMPTWKRQPVLAKRQLVGTGETEINNLGFGAYVLRGSIWLPTHSAYATFETNNGLEGILTDGTTTWLAVLEFDVDVLAPADAGGSASVDGYTGTATFTRPQP